MIAWSAAGLALDAESRLNAAFVYSFYSIKTRKHKAELTLEQILFNQIEQSLFFFKHVNKNGIAGFFIFPNISNIREHQRPLPTLA